MLLRVPTDMSEGLDVDVAIEQANHVEAMVQSKGWKIISRIMEVRAKQHHHKSATPTEGFSLAYSNRAVGIEEWFEEVQKISEIKADAMKIIDEHENKEKPDAEGQ